MYYTVGFGLVLNSLLAAFATLTAHALRLCRVMLTH
jgi:hypothetical protein